MLGSEGSSLRDEEQSVNKKGRSYKIYLCALGAYTSFYATVESNVMLCITIQKNVM